MIFPFGGRRPPSHMVAVLLVNASHDTVDGARYSIISLLGKRATLVTANSVGASEIDYAVCRAHESALAFF
jgi:hypothetical protein